MINLSLLLALATIGALWLAIGLALANSLRRSDEPLDTLTERLAAKTAPWRKPPENRTIHKDLLA